VGHQLDQAQATRVRYRERVHYTRMERRTLMQAGVDQKVLDDAELIALVRQTQDQFEAHDELNAC
jgi:hypothetical protein